MPTNLLNLRSYVVLAVDENNLDYHIRASVKDAPAGCPYCASRQIVGFGRREQLVRDLPMHGKRVGIYVDTRRMKCQSCGKTFSEALPDVDDKRAMTVRLERWIGQQAIKRTFASIAEETGVTEGTVRNVFGDYVNRLEDKIRFETPRWMGIDEIHLIKPRCVISNIEHRTLVEILHNRNKDTVVKYLSGLKGRENVRYVTMDMWTPYRDAVRQVMPQASIIIDKFHVVRMANDAMEKARKGLREQLTLKQRRSLMHDRFVLLKREHDLNDKERLLLDGWTINYPTLSDVYRLKEGFYAIFDAESISDAKRRYAQWYQGIQPETKAVFSDLIRAWGNWEPYILGYFEHPITNAYTESLNNLIRVMNRLGRGYSFEALRAKLLFAEGAFKREIEKPKFQRRDWRQVDYNLPDGGGVFNRSLGHYPRHESTEQTHNERNFGTDISTLIRLIESGEV